MIFMVKDESRLLVKRTYLDEDLKNVINKEGTERESMDDFSVDEKYSHFFEVLSGECVAATTWRENAESREVTGLFSLKSGEGCLYLPGEPYLIKFDSAEVSEFILGKNV